MQQKNKSKQERKSRPTWAGLKPRKEATKKERIERARKKYKKGEQEQCN